MRKRIGSQPQRESLAANAGWLDLEAVVRVEVTSEDAAHPIESALWDCSFDSRSTVSSSEILALC